MKRIPSFLADRDPSVPQLMYADPAGRLHPHIHEISVVVALYLTAVMARRTIPPIVSVPIAAIDAHQFDLKVVFHIGPVLNNALIPDAPIQPVPFDIWISPYAKDQGPEEPIKFSATKTQGILDRSVAGEFVLYFEHYVDLIRRQAKHSENDIDPTWRFAKVVRNSVVHGAISINDVNFMPVAWYGLSYGHADHGAQILTRSMGVADLMILMIEMDKRLTALGLA